MKYNDNGTYEDIVIKAVAPGRNSYSSSQQEVYSCNYVNGAIDAVDVKNNYSTSETVVGTWIDGKPLYRRVIDVTDTKTAQAAYSRDFDLTSYNIEHLFSRYILYHNSANASNTEVGNYNASSTDYSRLYRTKGSTYDKLRLLCYNNEQTIRLIAILEYTKTTD